MLHQWVSLISWLCHLQVLFYSSVYITSLSFRDIAVFPLLLLYSLIFFFFQYALYPWASQVAIVVKNPPANAGDVKHAGSIPGLGRSLDWKIPWRKAWQSIPHSCLRNPMDRGAWQATVHESQRAGHNWSDLALIHLPCKLMQSCLGFRSSAS